MEEVIQKCVYCSHYITSKEGMRNHYLIDHGWISISPDQSNSEFKPASEIDKRCVENEIPLNELKFAHQLYLSDRLDYSASGNDYKKLAGLFGLSRDDIEQLTLSPLRGQRPTEQLIRCLNMRYPELTVKDFERKCNKMGRIDIVNYLRKYIVLKNFTK